MATVLLPMAMAKAHAYHERLLRPLREMRARIDELTRPVREMEERLADYRRRCFPGWVAVEVDGKPSPKAAADPVDREAAEPVAAVAVRAPRKPDLDEAISIIFARDGYPAGRPGGCKGFCDKVRGLSGSTVHDRTIERHLALIRQVPTPDTTKLRVVS